MQKRVLTLMLPGILNNGTVLLLSYLLGSIIMLFSGIYQEKGCLIARCAYLVYILNVSKHISLPAAATHLESGHLDTDMCSGANSSYITKPQNSPPHPLLSLLLLSSIS